MKKFVQYGAGNIGRGFIGQLFSKAGYEVSFIDVNMEVIDALNNSGRYPVTVVSKDSNLDIWVENVKGVDGRDKDAVIAAIAGADMMATAIGVNILPRIVPLLADGIRKRMIDNVSAPLNIIICENLIDADKLLHKMLLEHFNADEAIYFENHVGLVEASIGRMVPVMTQEQKESNVLRVCVESYCELPVDKTAFKGDIPEVPHLFPYSPFEFYIKRKLYVHNMGHALTSYLGSLAGYEYIWQATGNPAIKIMVQRAMTETALSLSKKFDMPMQQLVDHISHLQIRFSNVALGDTIARVGNDIKRKLSSSDRFAGALKFCDEQGVVPLYAAAGIAAAMFFENPADPFASQIRELIAQNGLKSVLKDICDIDETSQSFNTIVKYYEFLSTNKSISDLLAFAESLQQDYFDNSGKRFI
jgi:mannitol-1-phosphate 5-dehydrogenase